MKEIKYTLCPPGPEPKRHTASCPRMVAMLKGGDDLTIDQRRHDMVRPRPLRAVPFEDRLANTIALARGMKE